MYDQKRDCLQFLATIIFITLLLYRKNFNLFKRKELWLRTTKRWAEVEWTEEYTIKFNKELTDLFGVSMFSHTQSEVSWRKLEDDQVTEDIKHWDNSVNDQVWGKII